MRGDAQILSLRSMEEIGDGPGYPIAVMASEPMPCGFCRRLTMFFVNRWGTSRCKQCDQEVLACPKAMWTVC